MLITKVRFFIIGIQLVEHCIFRKRIHDPRINKETVNGVAVKVHLSSGGLYLEEILELKSAHQILQEKVPNVQFCGCGSLIIGLFYTFIIIR